MAFFLQLILSIFVDSNTVAKAIFSLPLPFWCSLAYNLASLKFPATITTSFVIAMYFIAFVALLISPDEFMAHRLYSLFGDLSWH